MLLISSVTFVNCTVRLLLVFLLVEGGAAGVLAGGGGGAAAGVLAGVDILLVSLFHFGKRR